MYIDEGAAETIYGAGRDHIEFLPPVVVIIPVLHFRSSVR